MAKTVLAVLSCRSGECEESWREGVKRFDREYKDKLYRSFKVILVNSGLMELVLIGY